MSSRPYHSDAAGAVHIPDHTLLRVIGRGSYGDVWLALNVMGTHRAVKIVRRAAFDSDRPYLREFEGIRRCEPVSRAHDGLIDILHMGRNDEHGWFYYVMELADGADEKAEPDSFATYRPATLSERFNNGKPMDATECLRVAESLAGALAFLHEQGLIHRDVKPSNILYVGGIPKLGDIGLVAEAGSSRSFVGTEGFVPQEGPGTERADIFALGKVLYEALTGLDRSKFPRLPTEWRNAYDLEQRLELNEIVLRACEGHPESRYFSARDVLADIALVASGRSVRKLRGMEHRMRLLRWLGLTAVAVAVVALGVSWLLQREASGERTLRLRAEHAEKAQREGRIAALLDQVHAARHDPSPGAVTRGLRAAAEAAALQVTPELRNDAIFLLGRPDFLLRDELDVAWDSESGKIHLAVDGDSGLYAEAPMEVSESPKPLPVTLHVAGAPEKKRTLTVEKPPPSLARLQFSRGGQRLLLAGWRGGGTVIDTISGAVLQSIPPSSPFATALCFCGEKGDTLIRRDTEGGFTLYDVPGSGERLRTLSLENWPVRDQRTFDIEEAQQLFPSPDGRYVLLVDTEFEVSATPGIIQKLVPGIPKPAPGAACLVEAATGRILWKVSGPDEQVAAWSPDSTRVAVRAGNAIRCLDAARGGTVATIPHQIFNRGTEMLFLDNRDRLVFATFSVRGLCDFGIVQLLCAPPPMLGLWSYSPVKNLLSGSGRSVEWRPSPVCRTFHPQGPSPSIFFSWSPDELWLITGNDRSFECWPAQNNGGAPVTVLPARGASSVLFTPDGGSAQFLTSRGISEVPWSGRPPETLPAPQLHGLPDNLSTNFASRSADGKVRAFGGNNSVMVIREGGGVRAFPCRDSSNPLSLSPGGQWFALGAQHSSDVRIWDLSQGGQTPVHVETCGFPCVPAFSPDGKWLAISGTHDNRILETGTWKVVQKWPRSSYYLIGEISFTADSRLMAVKHSASGCTLIEPGTWRTRYQIASPLDEVFERCALSPGGRYFTAVGSRREIYVWDLKALDAELRKLGLEGGGDRTQSFFTR